MQEFKDDKEFMAFLDQATGGKLAKAKEKQQHHNALASAPEAVRKAIQAMKARKAVTSKDIMLQIAERIEEKGACKVKYAQIHQLLKREIGKQLRTLMIDPVFEFADDHFIVRRK